MAKYTQDVRLTITIEAFDKVSAQKEFEDVDLLYLDYALKKQDAIKSVEVAEVYFMQAHWDDRKPLEEE